MTRFLVTGGAGFIGSNIVKKLAEEQQGEIRVVDNLSTGKRDNLASLLEKVDFQVGDIRDMEFINEQMKDVDIVFHEAAIPSVERSIKDPLATNDSNIQGTLNVLLAAKENGIKRLVYASSSAVYGDSLTLPKREDMPVNPLSPYSLTKYAGERYCQLFFQLYGLETVCLRYFNVFGPNQDAGSHYAAVIPRFIAAIMDSRPITIYGDGEQTRDFSYIDNVVTANILAASASYGIGDIFNISCGYRITVNQLAHFLMDVLDNKVQVAYEDARAGEVKHSLADISRAEKNLGYSPAVDVWEGLRISSEWAQSASPDTR